MFSTHSKIRFPVWQYLNQPLFEAMAPTVLNPYRFWFRYQVNLFERCLAKGCTSEDSRCD